MIVCFSRCLWCGRRTPHEVCHLHRTGSRLGDIDEVAVNASPDPDREWSRRWERSQQRAWKRWFYAEPETCTAPCPFGLDLE